MSEGDSREARLAGQTTLRAYTVGPPPATGVRRLHLNEFRYDHAAGVVAALRTTLGEAAIDDLLTHYQAGPSAELLDDFASYVGVPGRQYVTAAAGSDEVLRAVIDTSSLRGHKKLVMGIPGYTHFEHYAQLKGLEIVAYPIGLETTPEDHLASLQYYAFALSEGCLVYLCSPNNPTGDLWSCETIATLAGAYPRSLFLVDEAYVEFASAGASTLPAFATNAGYAIALNARSVVGVAAVYDNVVVTRTMSKAFGLAALRIGYAIASPRIIGELNIAISPKAFNPIAARTARAALQSLSHYFRTTSLAKAEARRVVSQLCGAGWWAIDTPGNFYLVYVGESAVAAVELARRGIQVRDRGDLPGLHGFVRLTAGTAEDSEAVLAAFADLTPYSGVRPQELYTSKGIVAAVKTLMKRTLIAAAQAGVEVWAQGGTMLGMFRHRNALIPGGMIPWDDDGDLAYLIDGDDPLAPHVEAFREAGLTLQRNRTSRYWQVGTNAPGTVITPVHIDVFSYRAAPEPGPDGKPVYILDDERFREEEPDSPGAHCNTKYGHDELYPLSRDYRFYDLMIPMPAASEVVLRRSLGDGFMELAKVRTGEDKPAAFVIKDRTPA